MLKFRIGCHNNPKPALAKNGSSTLSFLFQTCPKSTKGVSCKMGTLSPLRNIGIRPSTDRRYPLSPERAF